MQVSRGRLARRKVLVGALAVSAAACNPLRRLSRTDDVLLVTFGDSILDCGRYNPHAVHPGQLIVRNIDHLFPEFEGYDLASRGPARLEHRARDGATVRALASEGLTLRQIAERVSMSAEGVRLRLAVSNE